MEKCFLFMFFGQKEQKTLRQRRNRTDDLTAISQAKQGEEEDELESVVLRNNRAESEEHEEEEDKPESAVMKRVQKRLA